VIAATMLAVADHRVVDVRQVLADLPETTALRLGQHQRIALLR
jgi:hypothetical protein